MSRTMFNGAGQAIVLGKKLGTGGEGSVYEMVGVNHLVAKVYHEAPDQQKQAKLRLMSRSRSEQLLKYTAWPQDTLHSTKMGSVTGFVMAKVEGMTPVQTLYSPAHRKSEYPDRAWDFLLFAARNTASAFTALHEHGHVLGDVNHGNAYVGSKATIVLIDTDSYQIHDGNRLHLCEVGVSHYTPPELQGISFKGVTRTANHDNFGLALLIFHLLFGGRHPFAGVPQRDGIGESLEDNIKQLRFAYSRSASQRLLTSPPNSLPLSLVPPRLENMFEAAFTEEGRAGRRPTAKQWLDELDEMRKAMRVCGKTKMHVFSNHLRDCPWCALENKGVVYFINATVYATGPTGTPVNIGQVWAAICNVEAPVELPLPQISQIKVTATPPPTGFVPDSARWVMSIGLIAAVIFAMNAIPAITLWLMVAGAGGLVGIWNIGSAAKRMELSRRSSARQTAQQHYKHAVEALNREAGVKAFSDKHDELGRLKSEFDQLPASEQRELASLQGNAEKRQKQKHLDKYFIDKANLPGIGPAKRAALQSFGIETAGDVEWNRVRRIKGFGDVLTRTLVDWRKSHERNFRFNPSQAVTPADINAVKQAIQARKQQIDQQMRAGLQELRQFATKQQQAIHRHQPTIQAAAKRLAQAEADCAAL